VDFKQHQQVKPNNTKMYAVPQTEQKINTQNACLKTPQKYKMKVIQSAYKEPTYKELLVIRN